MINLYKIHNYRLVRGGKPSFSIDRVDQDGKFVNQVSFYFETRADAKKRLAEIIAEDNNGGEVISQEYKRTLP